MVEAAGVEPASGNDPPGVSTRLAGPFDLALRPPVRQGDARPACKSRQRMPGKSNDHPANRRPARFQREEEAADELRVFTQPVQRYRWHLSLGPRFYEVCGTSACNPGFTIPVEAVSPPKSRSLSIVARCGRKSTWPWRDGGFAPPRPCTGATGSRASPHRPVQLVRLFPDRLPAQARHPEHRISLPERPAPRARNRRS